MNAQSLAAGTQQPRTPITEATDLPFVKDEKNGRKTTRSFWAVQPVKSNRGLDQTRQGEELALAALEYMVSSNGAGGYLLASIAADQPAEATSVEGGFWKCIGDFASAGRQTYGDRQYRDYMRREGAALEAYCEEAAERRSAHARHAAQARWAKNRAAS